MSHYPNGSVLQIPASTNQGSSTLCLKDPKFEYLIGNCCQKERSQTLTILDKEKVLPGVHAALSYIRAFSCHSQMCQGLSSIKATKFGDLNLFCNFLTSKHGCQDGKSFLPLNSCSNMVLHCIVFAWPLKICRQEEFHHVHNTW
jgi:hypothetical protein